MYRVVASGDVVYGKEAVAKYYDVWWTAFPDVNIEIKRIVATGEWVFAENFVTATHLGPWLGMAPTGKKVDPASVRGDPLPRRADDRGVGVLRPARAAAPARLAVHARRPRDQRAGVEGSAEVPVVKWSTRCRRTRCHPPLVGRVGAACSVAELRAAWYEVSPPSFERPAPRASSRMRVTEQVA